MSSRYTTKPDLTAPWLFEPWDNLKTSIPPWQIRKFWYADGDGDYVVLDWHNCFNEGGYWSYCGNIRRFKTGDEAMKEFCRIWIGKVREGVKTFDHPIYSEEEKMRFVRFGWGVYLFYKYEELHRFGERFPGKELPDGRW